MSVETRDGAPKAGATKSGATKSGAGLPPGLERRARQFLVHSFLYYRLDESVLSDQEFDAIAGELGELRGQHPEAALPYPELIDPALGPEASAFAIRDYPPEIVTEAFKLLHAVSAPDADFEEFVQRRGYRIRIDKAKAG